MSFFERVLFAIFFDKYLYLIFSLPVIFIKFWKLFKILDIINLCILQMSFLQSVVVFYFFNEQK